MTKTSKTAKPSLPTSPIIFFGNERLATGVTTTAPVLQALIAAGYPIAAVVSNYTEGTSRNARDLEIGIIAKEHSIPLLLPDRPLDIKKELAAYKAAIGVLVAYGKIVPEEIIKIFPKGIVNIHPSLLPRHRGPTPIESAIMAGELETGVSIMQLAKGMDAGPVFAQTNLTLKGSETKQDLADKLLNLGKDLLIDNLPNILGGQLKAKPQNNESATYDQLLTKDQGAVDWNQTAERIECQIRAFAGWPNSRAVLAKKEIIIVAATTVPMYGVPGEIYTANKELVVFCGKDALRLEKLKPAGKKEISGPDFIRGYLK
jgi:methionyl-tRNA formyltransferase